MPTRPIIAACLLALARQPTLGSRCRTLSIGRLVDDESRDHISDRAVLDAIAPTIIAQLPHLVELDCHTGGIMGDRQALYASVGDRTRLKVLSWHGLFEASEWLVEDALPAVQHMPLESLTLNQLRMVNAPKLTASFSSTRTLVLSLDWLETVQPLVNTLARFPALSNLELSLVDTCHSTATALAQCVDAGVLQTVRYLMVEAMGDRLHREPPFARHPPAKAGGLPALHTLRWYSDPGRRWGQYGMASLTVLELMNPRRATIKSLLSSVDKTYPALNRLVIRPRHADRAFFEEVVAVRSAHRCRLTRIRLSELAQARATSSSFWRSRLGLLRTRASLLRR